MYIGDMPGLEMLKLTIDIEQNIMILNVYYLPSYLIYYITNFKMKNQKLKVKIIQEYLLQYEKKKIFIIIIKLKW